MQRKTVPAKRVLLHVAPGKITDLHALTEACDFLALVRTLDPDLAVLELITTPDTYDKTVELARYFEKQLGAKIL